jgi:hypothetical protein
MDEVAAPRLIGERASGVPNPDNPGSRDNPAGFANGTAGRAGPSPPPPPQNATRFAKSGTRSPAHLALSMRKSSFPAVDVPIDSAERIMTMPTRRRNHSCGLAYPPI